MLRSQLSFDMCVIQFTDEGVCPSLTSVHGDVIVILTVPLSPLCVTARL